MMRCFSSPSPSQKQILHPPRPRWSHPAQFRDWVGSIIVGDAPLEFRLGARSIDDEGTSLLTTIWIMHGSKEWSSYHITYSR